MTDTTEQNIDVRLSVDHDKQTCDIEIVVSDGRSIHLGLTEAAIEEIVRQYLVYKDESLLFAAGRMLLDEMKEHP